MEKKESAVSAAGLNYLYYYYVLLSYSSILTFFVNVSLFSKQLSSFSNELDFSL